MEGIHPPKSAHVVSCNEVNIHNIVPMSSLFLNKASEADFIAFDLEFTGLCDTQPKDMNHRYMALKTTIESHAIVSVGFSLIKKTSGQDLVHTYDCDNFHFLTLKQGKFSMDANTGKFLVKHQFSFDQLFAEGVPFWPPWHGKQYTTPMNELFKGLMQVMARRHIPLVTHNGLYDLLYIYHSFVGELPQQLSGFLKDFSNRFPSGVYDTKFLAEEEGFDASFLSYVFARCDRLRQDRYQSPTKEKPYFEVIVQDPVSLEGKKRKAVDEALSLKKQKGLNKKGTFCQQFAERGYCEFGHDFKSKLHDVQIILDDQLGPSKYPQVYSSAAVMDTSENPKGIAGAHSSHFDAYMTAFAFCYLSHTMCLDELEKGKNKLNVGGLNIPLTFPTLPKGRSSIDEQDRIESEASSRRV